MSLWQTNQQLPVSKLGVMPAACYAYAADLGVYEVKIAQGPHRRCLMHRRHANALSPSLGKKVQAMGSHSAFCSHINRYKQRVKA